MTAVPGVSPAELRAAVTGVRPGGPLDDDQVATAFAAGAWTGIAEPGDRVAGALVAQLGASEALAALVSGRLDDRDVGGAVGSALARWRPRLDLAVALRAFRNAAQLGTRLVLPTDPTWPAGLADLGVNAPIALWLKGDPAALLALRRSIALVGARAASEYGERVAADAATDLVAAGVAVVSGAAYGIDGVAHRAALAAEGTTVAVLAGGLDRLYPSGHVALLHRIAASGAILAELPCGFAPSKWRFLQRNRLIAAASTATVVLEAGARSGSLNTAGHGAALGRPLGAVPGSVYAAGSAGCLRLLREYNAVCVRNGADMRELLGDLADQPTLAGLEPVADPTERRVLDALGSTPRAVHDVARRAGLSPADAEGALGLLTLAGAAQQTQQGWRRAPRPR